MRNKHCAAVASASVEGGMCVCVCVTCFRQANKNEISLKQVATIKKEITQSVFMTFTIVQLGAYFEMPMGIYGERSGT